MTTIDREGSRFDPATIVRPLRKLRIDISANLDDDEQELDENTPAMYSEDTNDLFNASHAKRILLEAKDLRVLKLKFPTYGLFYAAEDLDLDPVPLRSVLGSLTFSHLYELAPGNCAVSGGNLIDILLRHKKILRRLSLSSMQLYDGDSWLAVFTRLVGQLPNLGMIESETYLIMKVAWTPLTLTIQLLGYVESRRSGMP